MERPGGCRPGLGQSTELDALLGAPAFQQLDSDAAVALRNALVRSLHQHGNLIDRPDEGGLFGIVLGGVALDLISRAGQRLTLTYEQPGDIFALGGLGRTTGEDLNAVALTDGTVVYRLTWSKFAALSRKHVSIALAGIWVEQDGCALREHLLTEHVFFPIKARLAHLLANLALLSPTGTVKEIQEDLASLIGSTRSRVHEALHGLRQEGIIDFHDHTAKAIQIIRRRRFHGRRLLLVACDNAGSECSMG